MLMICHRKSDIRKLEDKLLKNKHLKKIENEELLDGETKKEQGNRPREYRIASSRDVLNAAVYQTLNDNRKLWDIVVIFGPEGWQVIENSALKNISMLGPSASKTKHSIERAEPVNVGDKVYVVYKDSENGPPKVSPAGLVTRQLKYSWEVKWDGWQKDGSDDRFSKNLSSFMSKST